MLKYLKKLLIFILIFSCLPSNADAADYSRHWAVGIISKWISSGRATGDENGNFLPDRPVSRAEFIALLARDIELESVSAAEDSAFSDVHKTDWFYEYINAALENRIISGTGDSLFMPKSGISRQDAAVVLGRAYGIEDTRAFDITRYPDGVYISDYALGYMSYMCENGILEGYDNMVHPLDGLTRAEAVVLIDRMHEFSVSQNVSIKFDDGYPRLKSEGLKDGFNILIKTNKPCRIYYTMEPAEKSAVIPGKDNITSYLVDITDSGSAVSAYIPAGSETAYNLFFKAVDAAGSESQIAIIKSAMVLFFPEGSGTEQHPYLISTEQQLSAIRFFPDKSYKLKNDIVLSDSWTPIGSADIQSEMFSGTLDGAGFKISNLNVNQTESHAGLFAYLFTAKVKNLYVSAKQVYGKSYVGIIAGESNGATIENCFTDGLVKAEESYAGAITGKNNGNILRCQSAAFAVAAGSSAGGIAGINLGLIEESMSCTYSVSADMYSSGIAGENSGTIKNCIAANMNITDLLTHNNGKITTNKSGGVTKNNYVYDKVYSTTGNTLPGADTQNGTAVSWDDLRSMDFYTSYVGWSFDKSWRISGKDASFRLPSLKGLSEPDIEEGITMYAPKRITSEQELADIGNYPDNHYILANDIYMPDGSSWTPLFSDSALISDGAVSGGFTGSLDGNGYTIYNLCIEPYEGREFYGLFGILAGGTVRNLNLEKYSITSSDTTGAIAALNYGTIEHCTSSGEIRTGQVSSLALTGAVSGINYGTISDCDVNAKITVSGNSSTTGGICANNEGIIYDSSAKGSITVTGRKLASESTNGGIAGFNSGGDIRRSFSSVDISAKTHTAYAGGIAGMLNGGEIYQGASSGSIKIVKLDTESSAAYAGGIAGLCGYATIIHSFSHTSVYAQTISAYSGGIAGYNLGGYIQDTYSANKIDQSASSESYAGGIAGVNEDGFISENVSLVSKLPEEAETGRICAKSDGGMTSRNYAYDNMKSGSGTVFEDSELNGTGVDIKKLKQSSFYFTPQSDGGDLGWISGSGGAWIWGASVNPYYQLPLLNDVKYQDTFLMPAF